MILGIGCDICSISRMEKILQKKAGAHFLQRVFSAEELALFGVDMTNQTDGNTSELSTFCTTATTKTAERMAGNFAAKEAFLKAVGTGLSGFALSDIAALRKKSGAPYYACSGNAETYLAQNGCTAHLSISHDGGIAMAYCIIEQA